MKAPLAWVLFQIDEVSLLEWWIDLRLWIGLVWGFQDLGFLRKCIFPLRSSLCKNWIKLRRNMYFMTFICLSLHKTKHGKIVSSPNDSFMNLLTTIRCYRKMISITVWWKPFQYAFREHSHMTSDVLGVFLTYLPTYLPTHPNQIHASLNQPI